MVVNLYHQRWGNLPKLLFKRSIICHLDCVFSRVGTAQLSRFQWKDIMVLGQKLMVLPLWQPGLCQWLWYHCCGHCPGHWGFLFWEFGGRLCYSSPPQLYSWYLSSTQCMHFEWWDPVAESHLQFAVLGSWHWCAPHVGLFCLHRYNMKGESIHSFCILCENSLVVLVWAGCVAAALQTDKRWAILAFSQASIYLSFMTFTMWLMVGGSENNGNPFDEMW